MPLIIDSICHIRNAGVVPLGVPETFSINEKGKRCTKIRINHDCSLLGPSDLSVNKQVPKENLQPCFYGLCLLRKIHTIVAIRIKFTSKHILIGIKDLYAAYRRVHANAKIASTRIVIMVKLDFLCLYFPFGTKPTPARYTTTSEAEIDPENYLIMDALWDTTNPQSPHRNLLPRED